MSPRRTCPNGHVFNKTSDCLTCPICEKDQAPKDGWLSQLSAPARRALEAEGIADVKKLAQCTEKEVLALSQADAHKSTETIIALSTDSKDAVETIYQKAIAAGATEARPAEEYPFMYTRSFNDPDGHIWEVFHMDVSKFPQE